MSMEDIRACKYSKSLNTNMILSRVMVNDEMDVHDVIYKAFEDSIWVDIIVSYTRK